MKSFIISLVVLVAGCANAPATSTQEKEYYVIKIVGEQSPKFERLKYGDKNKRVKKLQTQLKKLGYYNFNITGYYGKITNEAVINFQYDNSISEDDVGYKTWQKLFNN